MGEADGFGVMINSMTGGASMSDPPTPYKIVYHVATLNHWVDVVREQMPLVAGNRFWKSLTVSVASASDVTANEAAELIQQFVPASKIQFYRFALANYEHAAMGLVDDLAEEGVPLLYFHAKAVSYNPADIFAEKWRQYLNRLIRDADKWSSFVAKSEFDACGLLKVFDSKHGYTYFAGNFWMAKGGYLRQLEPYRQFASRQGSDHQAFDRHRAELAVNRSRQMKAYAIDDTDLTAETVFRYLHDVLFPKQ